MAKVSVREHAAILRGRLILLGRATFAELVADCTHTIEVVARFLGLLELYREATVLFQQEDPLGELWVEWTGPADAAEATVDAAGTDADDEEYG